MTGDYSDAIEHLLQEHVVKYAHPEILDDANSFRKETYYTQHVDKVLTKYLQFLEDIFCEHCSKKHKNITSVHMNILEWIRFCVNARLIDVEDKDQYTKALFIYKRSLPLQDCPISTASMGFASFVEAVCRCIVSVKLHVSKKDFDRLDVDSYVGYVNRMFEKNSSLLKNPANDANSDIGKGSLQVAAPKLMSTAEIGKSDSKSTLKKAVEDTPNAALSYFSRGCSIERNNIKLSPPVFAWKISCVFEVWKKCLKLMGTSSTTREPDI